MRRHQSKKISSEPTIIAEQNRNQEGAKSQPEKEKDLKNKSPVASEPTIIAEQKRKPTKKD